MNRTRRLRDFGQSLWIDTIRRGWIEDGSLARLIEEDGLAGITSNPTIFEKAIGGSADYDAQLADLLAASPRAGAGELFEALAVADVQRACDLLAPVYAETGGEDGYVSLEVSPYLAHDTAGTEDEVRRLWRAVDRRNLMVKVPATPEGIPAIERLTGEGINVNVTLMFSLAHYEAVAWAYIRGLERLAESGDDAALGRVASVASFFVSRVDSKVDPRLDRIGTDEARELRGKIAIDNSKLAYRRFRELFHGEPFARLAARGARRQRVLWGSTSTKDRAYRDVVYVEELIGPETVNTVPPATVDAFRDHGEAAETVTRGWDDADRRLATMARLGIDLDEVTEDLQREGVLAFAESYDRLLAALEGKRRVLLADGAAGRQRVFVGRALGPIGRRLDAFGDRRIERRLWSHDRTLWSAEPVPELLDRMGWLNLPETQFDRAVEWAELAAEAADGCERVLLLGMGGSSLAPEVFAAVLGPREGFPRLGVLDSTHPEAVRRAAAASDPARTLHVVSSKSGTTTETLSLFRFFWRRAVEALGEEAAGRRFVAITDPGTPLARLAAERGFRRTVEAPPEVGGRYSALSPFGLVPAALLGVDPAALLDRAWEAGFAFGPERPARVNEAVALGAALGELAAAGRDKLTFLTTPALAAFPGWIEQLVAESTGKEGRGIVPVVGDDVGETGAAGDDRVYVGLALDGDGEAAVAARLRALERAGHPTVGLRLRDRLDLAGEMLRWEIATAAAAIVLGVQPFDQPDVQLAKDLAREAIAGGGGAAVAGAIPAGDDDLPRRLAESLGACAAGDYLALHAYLPPGSPVDEALSRLRRALAERTGCAVTLGWGPRFLHSTGQLHKGGPPTGVHLQLVDTPADDLAIPETDLTFARLIASQAAGDRRALEQRGRGVLAVDLGADAAAALERLAEAVAAGAPAAV
ncbi:MAG TPA: bifunctional transaldolase/phosoglucose isomerase [Thermoanaerobaculia bacterium]|nr:bifunctional transaldolase/phosoglucose isomerase [Thermoanaerobaculia bacterium]